MAPCNNGWWPLTCLLENLPANPGRDPGRVCCSTVRGFSVSLKGLEEGRALREARLWPELCIVECTGQLAKLVVFILKTDSRGSERLRPCQGHRVRTICLVPRLTLWVLSSVERLPVS